MNWPPVKAWKSKFAIRGNIYFVAINYGGELSNKWVVLMSVLDSRIVIKVAWPQLIDSSKWESGWDEITNLEYFKLINGSSDVEISNFTHLSADSGLTIPITEKAIRPWFEKIK